MLGSREYCGNKKMLKKKFLMINCTMENMKENKK